MHPVEPRPLKVGASDNRTFVSRVRMMLVTFIALTCVSCSLFPKKELSGTADERPKAAQNILTTLNSVNATLEVLYTSVSRGLDESVLATLEYFVVEAAAKKTDTKEQADLIKTGLEILVDLKSSKIDAANFNAAVNALRSAIILFDISTLRYLQDVGRLPVPQSLALNSELFAINNSLARGLFTLAAVVERAGLEPKNGSLSDVGNDTLLKVKEIESKLTKLKTETFLLLQPFLAEALALSAKLDPAGNKEFQQTQFALAALSNGVLLSSALQSQKDTGQIDKSSLTNSLREWSVDLKATSAKVATGIDAPALPTIPESAPKLDGMTGALANGAGDWVFTLVEKPTLGSVNLATNPPIYTPAVGENFSIDRYSFRACFKMIPTFCTASFAVIIQTPIKPWTVNLKTSEGLSNTFVRGDELVCSAALENASQTAIYRWTLVGLRLVEGATNSKSMDVTSWQTSPGRLKVPNTRTAPAGSDLDVREGDKIRCEVKARSASGLESSYTAPTLAVMTAGNSSPSDITLPALFLGFDEQIANESSPLESFVDLDIAEMDGAWREYTDTDSATHISGVTIENCDVVTPCPFEREIPQTQNSSRQGTYKVKIKQVGLLNYEAKPYYDLTLKVVDAKGQQLSKIVRVQVLDRNDPVTSISTASNTSAENQIFSTPLTAADQDCPAGNVCQNSGYTYRLMEELDYGYFEILGRTLKSKNNLNFEQVEAGNLRSPTYSVKVQATDSAGLTYSAQTITINVTNVNETPSGITLSNLTVSENTAGSVVLDQLTTSDPDGGDVFTYTLTMTNTLIPYFLISGENVIVNPAHTINFEETPNLEFIVTSQDLGGKTVTQSFSIIVLDVNEAPTNISFSENSILQVRSIQGRDPDNLNSVHTGSFIDLFTIDPDGAGESFTYEIISINGITYDSLNPTNHPFIIVNSTLRPQRVIDIANEINPYFVLKLKAKDQGHLYSPEISVTLNLLELLITGNEIFENTAATAIGNFKIQNGSTFEEGNSWTYAIPIQAASSSFLVSGRELRTTSEIDFETFPSLNYDVGITPQSGYFNLKVNASNTDGRSLSQQIKVVIKNKPETPTTPTFIPVLPSSNSEYFLLDGQAAGSLVGELTTTDQDIGSTAGWFLFPDPTSDDDEKFEIVSPISGNSKRAEIRIKETLPTGRSQFKIKVNVSDGTNLAQTDLTFKVVTYPTVSLQAGNVYQKGLHELGESGLQVDVKINDVTGTATCTKSSGNNVGIHIENLTNPSGLVLEDAGISIAQKSSGIGQKICTVSLLPNENAAGDFSFEMKVKSTTSVGVLSSLVNTSVSATFWRKPELRCPQRISLPPAASLTDIACNVHYSDSSAPIDRSSELITASGCALSWASGKLTGTMPTESCNANVSVSGVTNKFGQEIAFSTQTLALVPKKFGTNGVVFASAKDPSGNVYLGGSFTAVNPIPAPGATAVTVSDASRDAGCNLTEGFNGPVHSVVYDAADDSFLIGGQFTQYRNQSHLRFVRVTCSGEPASWFTNKGFNGPVHSILKASDGSIFVGGSFSHYGSTASSGLVRLNSNGVLLKSYNGVARAESSDGVYALALASTSPESLWVGGRFSQYNSDASFANLARMNLDTGLNLLAASPSTELPVFALAATSGSVYVGGEFTGPGVGVVKLANNGSKDSLFSSGSTFSDAIVHSLLLKDSHLFVGGALQIAKLGASDGSLDTSFGLSGILNLGHSNSNDTPMVYSLTGVGSDVVAGGRFTSIGASARRNLAKFTVSVGAIDSSFNSGVGLNDAVRSLTLFNSSSSIALGGEFSSLGGTPAGRLAAFAPNGTFDTDLNGSLGTGFNGDVLAMLFSGNDLYLGGAFSQVAGNSQARLVKLTAPANADGSSSIVDGTFDTSTSGVLNGDVRALSLASDNSGQIFAAGAFTQYRGSNVPGVTRINTNGTIDTSFNTGAGFIANSGRSLSINTLAVTPSTGGAYSVYIGGDFARYKGTLSPNLVKVSHLGTRDTNFSVGSVGFDAPLRALQLSGSSLIVGGSFNSYRGTASPGIIALNASSAAPISLGSLSGGEVRALQIDAAGNVWAGGSFTSVAGVSSGPLVQLEPSTLNLVMDGGATSADAANVIGKTVLGAHAPSEWNSSGSGNQYNSSVFGIHSILLSTETVNSVSVPRLYLGGFFSLLKGFISNNSARIDLSGGEAFTP